MIVMDGLTSSACLANFVDCYRYWLLLAGFIPSGLVLAIDNGFAEGISASVRIISAKNTVRVDNMYSPDICITNPYPNLAVIYIYYQRNNYFSVINSFLPDLAIIASPSHAFNSKADICLRIFALIENSRYLLAAIRIINTNVQGESVNVLVRKGKKQSQKGQCAKCH